MNHSETQIGEVYLIDAPTYSGEVEFGIGSGASRKVVVVKEWKKIHNTSIKVVAKPADQFFSGDAGNVLVHFLDDQAKTFLICTTILRRAPTLPDIANSILKCHCSSNVLWAQGCLCGGK